ncbi:restriction endonuclease subunit S [Orbus wheelerorum]|uniref:restriction endonuclease subunit S n=1 Tax=Orbus wheelerorum TaxID=3074111 RepID=UPI00370D8F18
MSTLAKYQTYPEYKDSGVEWLGGIPSDWELKKLKYLSRIKTGDKDTVNAVEDGIYPFFVRSPHIERINSYTFDCEAVLTAGDGAGVGKIYHYVNGKFGCHQRVYALTNFAYVNGRFIYYYLLASFYKVALDGNAKSTVDSLRLPQFLNFEITFPDILIQTKILAFLDYETAKIDQLIEKQQKLIELLKEKRQAVISHAVTKGLDPNVKMKDSGVEWLGEVPEHWKIKPFKRFFKIRKRIAGTLGYDILSITQRGIKIKDIESGDGQLSMDYSKYQIVNEGDFAMNHMDLLTGFVDLSPYLGVTSPDYRVFTLEDSLSEPQYYLYLLQMCYINKIFYPLGQGAANIGRWRLPTEAFNEFNAPVPPSAEQNSISIYIKQNLSLYSSLVEKAELQINLLKERRTALISAAVTGKIDVREWQAPN